MPIPLKNTWYGLILLAFTAISCAPQNLNFLGSRSFSQPLDFKLQAEFELIHLADVPNGFPFKITKLPETLMVNSAMIRAS